MTKYEMYNASQDWVAVLSGGRLAVIRIVAGSGGGLSGGLASLSSLGLSGTEIRPGPAAALRHPAGEGHAGLE